DEELRAIPGQPPNMSRPPSGCAFQPRCPYRREGCDSIDPDLLEFAPGRARACHAPVAEVLARRITTQPDPDQHAAHPGAAPDSAIPRAAVAGAGAAGTPTEGQP
ncbi:MAG: oligopeptide/dipeptide ABC transporter ATP-binding protein, partial [Paracoccus sp. (in: a-proteobacteria)]